MTDCLSLRPVRGRPAKQERSERTREAIVQAVIALLAERGMDGLTHRLVAQQAGVLLASTTYYFRSKQDMIAAASNELLHSYLGEFSRLVATEAGDGGREFLQFIARMAALSVDENRTMTLAWCEIMLDCAHEPEGWMLARTWFKRMSAVWEQCARAFDLPEPETAGRAGMDITIGALFHGLALRLSGPALAASVTGTIDTAGLVQAERGARPAAPESGASGATRERILDAAVGLLKNHGAGGVSYRSVALETRLTASAVAYHFASRDALLTEAQALLVAEVRTRCRDMMSRALESLDNKLLVERAVQIIEEDASEFRNLNLSTYAAWLQATRHADLHRVVKDVVGDLHHAWRRILASSQADVGWAEPLLAQYLFVGRLIRTLASGGAAQNQTPLAPDLLAIIERRHWSSASGVGFGNSLETDQSRPHQ